MKISTAKKCNFAEKNMAADKKDPFDGEYVGNVWGWKISYFGLVVILLFLGMVLYRHWKLDVPFGIEDPQQEKIELPESTQGQ